METEGNELELRIRAAAPSLETALRDRVLFEAGAAAQRQATRRRLWTVSLASSAASVAASWLCIVGLGLVPSGRSPSETPHMVQSAPGSAATDSPLNHSPDLETPILTAGGIRTARFGERSVATRTVTPEPLDGSSRNEAIWRVGLTPSGLGF